MTQKFSQTSSVSTEAGQDQVKSGNKVVVEEEKGIIHSLNYSLNLVVLLRLRRPTPFCFLTLQGTTVYESTFADVSLVLWCAVVHIISCHVTAHGCVSRHKFLDVPGCFRSKFTVWKEEQFTVLPFQGIE